MVFVRMAVGVWTRNGSTEGKCFRAEGRGIGSGRRGSAHVDTALKGGNSTAGNSMGAW